MDGAKVSNIYIFDPKRLIQSYLHGENVAWLKIGKHNCCVNEDRWKSAADCVNKRAHTGIPEPCRIYEVFSYPLQNGDYDDVFRKILTDDMFALESSMAKNKLISDPYEIKAGDEFLYNVSRKQILNARKSFEHHLMVEALANKTELDLLSRLILENQINPFDEDDADSQVADRNNNNTLQKGRPDPLMEKLYKLLPDEIRQITTLNRGERYRYIIIRSSRQGFWYAAAYSIRTRQISVALETYGGVNGHDALQQFISDNEISIPGLTKRQGTRNLNKWSWGVIGSLDQDEQDILQWFLDNIMLMHQTFK